MTDVRRVPFGATDFVVHVDGPDDGIPTLLLHPWFGCWRFWLPVMERLPDRRVIAPDWYSLAGGVPTAEVTPQWLAAAVVAVLDELDIARADVIGNSVGGIVAQVLAVEYPDRVSKLVVVGTGAATDGVASEFATAVSAWVADPQHAHAAGVAGLVRSLVHRDPDPAAFERWVDIVGSADPAFVAAVLASCRALDLRPRLSEITTPTLVIRGELDSIRTIEHSRQLVAGIAGSRGVEMPDAGHSPMVDDPDAFVAVVHEFLKSPPAHP